MIEKKILKITDKSGEVIDYDIISAFYWIKTNKNYIIYTDNSKNEDGNLNIYASIYDPNDSTRLDDITTQEEWVEVEKRINNIINSRGEIHDKLVGNIE